MNTPGRGNVAARYLESLGEPDMTPIRLPLRPVKHNTQNKYYREQDLDILAKEMNISPTDSANTALLRTRFEAPSATVTSFKSPSNRSSVNSATGSPTKRHSDKDTYDTQDNYDVSPTRRFDKKRVNGNSVTSNYSDMSLNPLKTDMKTPKTRPHLNSPSNNTSKSSPGYEYLCRVQAIREWLECVIQEEVVQEPVELLDYIRNGIHLAKLCNAILPKKRPVFMKDNKLQFKHTENINRFFQLMDHLNIPDLFRFELTDLYDAKNIPKVWFCLHAMSYILHKVDSSYPPIENLVGRLDFTSDDIRSANRALVGTGLPNFSSANASNDTTTDENSYMNRLVSPEKLRGSLSPTKVTDGKPNWNKNNAQTLHSKEEDNPFLDDQNNYRRRSPKYDTKHSLNEGILELPATSLPRLSPDNYYVDRLINETSNVIKLQSLIRGANFRYRMFIDKIMLKSFSDEVTLLNCLIRGALSRRKTIHKHRDELLFYKYDIIDLQSIIRQKLLTRRIPNTTSFSRGVELQSILRGAMARNKISHTLDGLARNCQLLPELQAKIKGDFSRKLTSYLIPIIDQIHGPISVLQASARRKLFLSHLPAKQISGSGSLESVLALQAIIRASKVRSTIRKRIYMLKACKSPVVELQSISRGGISRTKLCNNVLVTLLYEDVVLNQLYAKVRGNIVRREVQAKKYELEYYRKKAIVPLQSLFRGVYSRFQVDIMLEDIYNDVSSLISLQCIIRGNKVRSSIAKMNEYYEENLDKLIKVQNIIKTKFMRTAYKQLLNLKNPPLSVIKRFAYLLSDSDLDYGEEMELADLKDKIIDMSKHNEDIELQIENLDIKLGLLDKNKITVEEFMKNRSKLKLKSSNDNAVNIKNMEVLNKTSRERMELYQYLFYFLQTKPIYISRIFKSWGISCKESDMYIDFQKLIFLLFPINNSSVNHHSREEYFYLKFILNLVELDFQENAKLMSDITKQSSTFWIDYLQHFNNSTYQRQHLKSLMGKLVSNIVDNDDLDFESDPSELYISSREREIRITGTTKKPEIVSPQVAIKDPEVSTRFVENLTTLRDYATQALNVIRDSVHKIPLHVRLIAKKSYELSHLNFPDRSEKQHLSVAGVIFTKHYISNILQNPENFGYLVKDPFNAMLFNQKAKSNLKYLSRVLLQIFSMKTFTDNFFKPLNDHVTSSMTIVKSIIYQLIEVTDVDHEYNMNDYDDIVTHDRPKLTMRVSDMISIEKTVSNYIDILSPSVDDQVYSIWNRLNALANSIDDFVSLSELGQVTLNLNPTTKEESVADAKARSLITQAKRCVLYIIRIQDGDELLQLLISGIKPEHEERFKQIVKTEKIESENNIESDRRKPYHETSLGDLSFISYHDLKKMCLERLLQLETMGHLTRNNSYQDILNQIAVDIKTKDSQRVMRKQQLVIAKQAEEKLVYKEKFLSKQLSEYNKHVETILSELQSKPKDRKIFNIIPVFSKQYFYHRELKKSNRLPRFGSYKYSAKKLIDQGIVKDYGGLLFKSSSSASKLDLMFSCHETGKFTIEAANGSVIIPGALTTITLDQLLNLQYESEKEMHLFDGTVVFDTNNLAGFIFRKFYDIKGE